LGAEADLIKEIVSVLESMHVPYLIGGSVALAAWAAPRTTHDLDVVVDLPEGRIDEFCNQLPQARYFIDPDAMREAFKRRDEPGLGMYSFLDRDTGIKIDLFPLRSSDAAQQTALKQGVEAEVMEGVRAIVYAPGDLLIQKLRWYAASDSERQFRDSLSLLHADRTRSRPLIDWDYIEHWAKRLGPKVQQAWTRVRDASKQVTTEEC
jgi:hypothetical protein